MRLLISILAFVLTASPACIHHRPAKIISWKDYSRISANLKWPYILRIQTSKGSLLYYGAAHTTNPDDPQISEIEKLWTESRPDIAFNEGGDPPIEKSRDEAVSKYGEPGLIRYLAARDKVPVRSLDPTRAEEIAFLFKRFSPEQVKLFFILRVAAQHKQRQSARSIEQELERVFPLFAATPGLNISPNSIVELESSYNRYFSERGSFKEVQMSWFDPTISENFLNEIARRSSEYRDQYMVDLIRQHVIGDGQRVFAVVGGTHVVMQEHAIRSLLR